jgi:hypothetical protein
MYSRNTGDQFADPPAGTESNEVITFVHGWNMSPEGSTSYAETLYKRLWHKGYWGRFAYFRWDTDWSEAFDIIPGVGEAVGAYLADFNGSELTAWGSGAELKLFIDGFPSSYRRMLTAHSMGNIVAGAALAQGLDVSKYVLLQAAVPASCYDDSTNMQETVTYTQSILGPDPTMWDETGADNDYDPEAYRGKLSNIGGEPVNFYQIADHATFWAWELNNDLTKPPGILASAGGVGYFYRLNNQPGAKCVYYTTDDGDEVVSGYRARAFACRSWSKAVGAKGETRGSIKGWVNNNDFGFGDVHSAEFVRSIQACDSFYEQLKIRLDFK